MTKKCNKAFNKKIYALNSENVAQNFVRLVPYLLPQVSTFWNHEKYGSFLPKEQTNDFVVSCVFLIDF